MPEAVRSGLDKVSSLRYDQLSLRHRARKYLAQASGPSIWPKHLAQLSGPTIWPKELEAGR
jgi:hypothetical protein